MANVRRGVVGAALLAAVMALLAAAQTAQAAVPAPLCEARSA